MNVVKWARRLVDGCLASSTWDSKTPSLVEGLESRQFLSATLTVANLDILPGAERMIFNKIQKPNTTIPNKVKDTGKLQLTNTGSTALSISGAAFSGPFKVVGSLPTSIAAGKSVVVTIQFSATSVPPFTHNQTSGTNAISRGGAWIGSLKFKTNDTAHATYTEELAGWYQVDSENNEEPNLVTLVNTLANYKTNIAPANTVDLTEGATTATYYGEESKNAYWTIANPSKTVGVRQLASFHSQGDTVPVAWYKKSDKITHQLFTSSGSYAQTFLPSVNGQTGVPAFGSFSPGSSPFGFRISIEWSDDKLNTKKAGGGHHVRFYPLRDHLGNILANTYLMTMDYSITKLGTLQNFDFQDNVFIVTNIMPAGN